MLRNRLYLAMVSISASFCLVALPFFACAVDVQDPDTSVRELRDSTTRGPFQRAIYTAKVSGTAAADLQLDSTHTLDPINVTGFNQCKVGFVFTQASMSAVRWTFESSNGTNGPWYPIGEFTKSSATLTGAQRVYDWTAAASGNGEVLIPTMRRYLRASVTGVSGTSSDELDSAEFTCGEF